ncbi:hypothetical protein KY343_05680 [Candidatus Woesearchaeota archaeon]|nr:hypothetical protein [Candidatus Woesearchaeota archaeon]
MRPFSEKIEPIPKHYYLINTQDKKGVYKFIRKDKEYYIFEFYKPPYEDGLQPINKRDIIREATKEELKEILIDEL